VVVINPLFFSPICNVFGGSGIPTLHHGKHIDVFFASNSTQGLVKVNSSSGSAVQLTANHHRCTCRAVIAIGHHEHDLSCSFHAF